MNESSMDMMTRSCYYDKEALSEILIEGALGVASHGKRVFPLQPGQKIPYPGFSWPYEATTDPVIITRWWQANQFANIGVVCGSSSDLTVLDIDMKNGKNGIQALEQMFPEVFRPGWFHQIPYVATPSGGMHVMMPYIPGLPSAKLKEGLDGQNDGTYVLAPPSWLQQYDAFYRAMAPGHIDLFEQIYAEEEGKGVVPEIEPPAWLS